MRNRKSLTLSHCVCNGFTCSLITVLLISTLLNRCSRAFQHSYPLPYKLSTAVVRLSRPMQHTEDCASNEISAVPANIICQLLGGCSGSAFGDDGGDLGGRIPQPSTLPAIPMAKPTHPTFSVTTSNQLSTIKTVPIAQSHHANCFLFIAPPN